MLPHPQVETVLLNTSTSSVSTLGAVRRVVDSAITTSAETPVTVQEAVAQVGDKAWDGGGEGRSDAS